MQFLAVSGRQYRREGLMRAKNFTNGAPGAVITLFTERILDGDLNVIGEDGEKDVRFDTVFQMVKDGTFGQGAFQVAEGLFDPCNSIYKSN